VYSLKGAIAPNLKTLNLPPQVTMEEIAAWLILAVMFGLGELGISAKAARLN
jgi:hypothetical protein